MAERNFKMKRREFREYIANMDQSDIVGMISSGSAMWQALGMSLQTKWVWERTYEGGANLDGEYQLRPLAEAAVASAVEHFNRACDMVWRTLVVKDVAWPPSDDDYCDDPTCEACNLRRTLKEAMGDARKSADFLSEADRERYVRSFGRDDD